jgi:hypothetical protein
MFSITACKISILAGMRRVGQQDAGNPRLGRMHAELETHRHLNPALVRHA